jgi:Tol biopolymer transport system component
MRCRGHISARFTFILFLTGCTGKNNFPLLKGPYLGQKPPGITPEIFAPGIISRGYAEYQISFTQDGKELFLWLGENRPYSVILSMKEDKSGWGSFHICSFSGKYVDMKCSLSPDGNRLLFSSNRPRQGNGEPEDNLDIWYVERSPEGWSQPRRFDSAVNTDSHDYYPTLSETGNLDFMSDRPGGTGEDDIYYSPLVNGKLTEAVNIGPAVNTILNEGDPYISPDESYLIFCSRDREGGFGNNDLYISFRNPDGSWTQAMNMEETINTAAEEVCPIVSHNGRYFFFQATEKRPDRFPVLP